MLAQNSKRPLSGVERFFDESDIIVSKTDLKGKLTYVNQSFLKIAGMNEGQCIGKPHNVIRNPEMPRCVFKLLWDHLQSGKEIFAYVNNRAINGDNYWVFAHVTPSKDGSGNIVGYHSNRRVPNRKTLDEHIIPLYRDLLNIEASNTSAQAAMQASSEKIESLLKENNVTFNEWMFGLGV